MNLFEEVKDLLATALQLADAGSGLTEDTELLGAMPELDSQAVVHVITALEDNFGFIVEDDEISGETFATLGALVEFVQSKVM